MWTRRDPHHPHQRLRRRGQEGRRRRAQERARLPQKEPFVGAAFRTYRDFDGKGGTFGGVSVLARTDDAAARERAQRKKPQGTFTDQFGTGLVVACHGSPEEFAKGVFSSHDQPPQVSNHRKPPGTCITQIVFWPLS
jgi:hypothetical protein